MEAFCYQRMSKGETWLATNDKKFWIFHYFAWALVCSCVLKLTFLSSWLNLLFVERHMGTTDDDNSNNIKAYHWQVRFYGDALDNLKWTEQLKTA